MTTFAEPTELEELESIYCDMHKDVYGVKARWYKAESVERARNDIATMQVVLADVIAEEKAAQQGAIAEFEKLAATYGGTETAKRYQHQAYGTDGDDEFLCYQLGLPYGYFKEAK